MVMPELPEFVYLITVDGMWPVSAIADCHPSTPEQVEREVRRRTSDRSILQAHVWKCRLADVQEVTLVPAAVVPPSLKEHAGERRENT